MLKLGFDLYIDRIHKLFFCLCANHPHLPHFGAKVLLNFVRANEASEDD